MPLACRRARRSPAPPNALRSRGRASTHGSVRDPRKPSAADSRLRTAASSASSTSEDGTGSRGPSASGPPDRTRWELSTHRLPIETLSGQSRCGVRGCTGLRSGAVLQCGAKILQPGGHVGRAALIARLMPYTRESEVASTRRRTRLPPHVRGRSSVHLLPVRCITGGGFHVKLARGRTGALRRFGAALLLTAARIDHGAPLAELPGCSPHLRGRYARTLSAP